jgi:hypothetical protein
MIKVSKEALDFNKEILFGEIGSLVGIQIATLLSIHFPRHSNLIPYFIVLGASVIGSLFWLLARIYYKSKKGKYSEKNFITDMEFFTPASVLFAVLFYYPALFFTSKFLLEHSKAIEFSAILSQVVAFLVFLLAINIYRYILLKVFNKKL